MKKVLLINAPFARIVGLEQDYVPMSLWQISTLLKKQGFEPYIKNLNIASELHYVNYFERNKKYSNLMALYDTQKMDFYRELNHAIKSVAPDVVGFTVLTTQIKIINDLINYININYGLPIFVGGAGVTLNYTKIKNANLLFLGGTNDLSIIEDIKQYEDTLITNKFSLDNYAGDLNFDGFLDNYSPDGYGHVFSSVGCYANCRFCASPAIWKHKVYFKPMDSFIKELRAIADKYNPSKFLIWDENFTALQSRLKMFCDLYDINIAWSCDSRIDSLDENKVSIMKEHGCYQINIGAESGCQKTLDYLNKGINKDKIKQIIDLLNFYDIKSKVYMIMGFPEETYEDMKESVEYITSCNPTSITLSLFTPYVNTSLYEECRQKGLIDDSYDESEHSHQSGNFMKSIHPEIDIVEIIKMIDEHNGAKISV